MFSNMQLSIACKKIIRYGVFPDGPCGVSFGLMIIILLRVFIMNNVG